MQLGNTIKFVFRYGYFFFFLIVVGLSYIEMNQPWIYKCSPSRSPLPPGYGYSELGGKKKKLLKIIYQKHLC